MPEERSPSTKAATLSTEPIATAQPSVASTAEACPACGSPLAGDQRYCLECGERRVPVSSFLRGGGPTNATSSPPSAPPQPPQQPPVSAFGADGSSRNSALLVIAGVGVLLLAMGVGVLIGRSSASAPMSTPAPVVTVASAPTGTTLPAAEAEFKSDWPAGKTGYTVELQTLPATATVSEVEAAKSAVTGKGAQGAGALKSEEFSSLTGSGYVIYSGQYTTKAEAQKALGGLKKNFASAKVVQVANAAGKEKEKPGAHKAEGTLEHPAPKSVLKKAKKGSGANREKESLELPNVVET